MQRGATAGVKHEAVVREREGGYVNPVFFFLCRRIRFIIHKD